MNVRSNELQWYLAQLHADATDCRSTLLLHILRNLFQPEKHAVRGTLPIKG